MPNKVAANVYIYTNLR